MPIFEYKCAECGKVMEVLHKTANPKKPVCEHCGSTKTQKQFSAFAPQVKKTPSPPNSGCMSCPNSGCPHAGGT